MTITRCNADSRGIVTKDNLYNFPLKMCLAWSSRDSDQASIKTTSDII